MTLFKSYWECMIENLEALVVLSREGTITKTATRLRLTQSAVSKRIAALENSVGEPVIEKYGRGVRLSPRGQKLVAETEPLIGRLRSALVPDLSHVDTELTIGVSESVFGSWGAGALFRAAQQCPDIRLYPHTHRSPAVLDRVRSGEYMLGLCSNLDDLPSGIVGEIVTYEPMVLIDTRAQGDTEEQRPIWSIEFGTKTGKYLSEHAARRGLELSNGLETFFGVAQAALAGFAVGLVPLGVAQAMRISKADYSPVDPALYRSVSIIAQKSTYNRAAIKRFASTLKKDLVGIHEEL